MRHILVCLGGVYVGCGVHSILLDGLGVFSAVSVLVGVMSVAASFRMLRLEIKQDQLELEKSLRSFTTNRGDEEMSKKSKDVDKSEEETFHKLVVITTGGQYSTVVAGCDKAKAEAFWTTMLEVDEDTIDSNGHKMELADFQGFRFKINAIVGFFFCDLPNGDQIENNIKIGIIKAMRMAEDMDRQSEEEEEPWKRSLRLQDEDDEDDSST